MRDFGRDLGYAVRSFTRQPALFLAIVGALAIGIGANSIIFTIFDAILLHPSSTRAWHDSNRIVTLWESNNSLSAFFAKQLLVRPANFRAWKDQSQSFQNLVAWSDYSVTLTGAKSGRTHPEQVEAGKASADFFPTLGVQMQLGRNFSASDVRRGDASAAILSDALFRGQFHSDPNVIGSALRTVQKTYTIIGVLPPALNVPAIWGGLDQKAPKLWTLLSLEPGNADKDSTLVVYGRLKDGVSLAAVRSEMQVIEKRLANTPLEEGGFGINVIPLLDSSTDASTRRSVWVLQIAVGFVLLIACANAGNLLLTRSASRNKEMAIRSAIGAGRARLLRQSFAEAFLLSACAAGFGLFLSILGMRVISAIAPNDLLSLQDLSLNRYVLGFALCLTFLTGLAFGSIPVYQAWKVNLSEVLGRSGRGSSGSSGTLRAVLIVSEIACSLVLVVGAALMVKSLVALMRTDLGFRIDHLLVMRVALPEWKYNTPDKVSSFDARLLQSVRSMTGIQSAALTTALPMKSVSQSSFEIPGRPREKDRLPVTDWARVSDQYFETLQILSLRGRTFTRNEVEGQHPSVAVVNESFIRTFFPHEDALGKLVSFSDEARAKSNFRIVGIVADEHQMGPDNPQISELYLPGTHMGTFLLVARTAGDAPVLESALKRKVWDIDRDQPIDTVTTEEAALHEWSAPRRFNLIVLLSFATVALLLAAMGLYTVLAYAVTLRTREIGIRIALGAKPQDITGSVLRNGLGLACAGIVIGLAISLILTRFMESLIYGVNAYDPLTLLCVVAGIVGISALASYVPALRASRVDPIEALRLE